MLSSRPTRPPRRPLPPLPPLLALLSSALLLLSCRDATGPREGGPLQSGREVSGTLSEADTVDQFTIRAEAGQELVVWIRAESGRFRVTVTRDDPASTNPPPGTYVIPLAETFASSATDVSQGVSAEGSVAVQLTEAGTYRVSVRPFLARPGDTGGRYRLSTWWLDRRPERAPERLTIGGTVDGERIDRARDIDEFLFHGEKGQTIVLLAEATGESGQSSLSFGLWSEDAVEGSGGFPLAVGGVLARAGVAALDDQGSGRIVLPATGDYRVRVAMPLLGCCGRPYVGPYRFRIVVVDARPETAPAQLVPGDTVTGEKLDVLGDVDEFTFTGQAGQQFNVFFQALDPSAVPSDVMQLRVAGVAAGGGDLVARAAPVGTPLLERGTGRFTLPASGTYTIRVLGERDVNGGARGRYRLMLYSVDPRPEKVAPATIALGDSVAAESMEVPGDVDEFTVTLPQRTLVNLALWRRGTQAGAGALSAEIVRGGQVVRSAVVPVATVLAMATAGAGSGVAELEAGTYTVRVSSPGSAPYAGPYSVQLAVPPGPAPERAAAAVAVGATVDESLDALGDVDVFTFSGVRGQHLDLLVRGPGAAGEGAFTFAVTGTSDAYRGAVADVSAPLGSTVLGASRTARFTLPATGSYEIRVASAGEGRNVGERGAYRFALVAAPTVVEIAPATLAVGASVTTERIDAGGDVDEFTVQGAPGSEVLVTVAGPPVGQTPGPRLHLDALDPATREPLPAVYINGFQGFNDVNIRFAMPAAGSALVQVYEPRPCVAATDFCGSGFYVGLGTGPYSLRTQAISRAPESVAATLAVGDTLRGEAIGFIADVDEFTLTGGTAGQRVVLYFSTSGSTYGALRAQLIDPATGAALATVSTQDGQPLGAHFSAPVTLPATGSYLLRVDAGISMGTSGYQLLVKAVP